MRSLGKAFYNGFRVCWFDEAQYASAAVLGYSGNSPLSLFAYLMKDACANEIDAQMAQFYRKRKSKM